MWLDSPCIFSVSVRPLKRRYNGLLRHNAIRLLLNVGIYRALRCLLWEGSYIFSRHRLLISFASIISICCILPFGWFPGLWMFCADVSEHSVPSSWVCKQEEKDLWIWNRRNVPKRRHIKFRAGELPKIKFATFTTCRKFEIKSNQDVFTPCQQAVA
jgi:hypothetical protein